MNRFTAGTMTAPFQASSGECGINVTLSPPLMVAGDTVALNLAYSLTNTVYEYDTPADAAISGLSALNVYTNTTPSYLWMIPTLSPTVPVTYPVKSKLTRLGVFQIYDCTLSILLSMTFFQCNKCGKACHLDLIVKVFPRHVQRTAFELQIKQDALLNNKEDAERQKEVSST